VCPHCGAAGPCYLLRPRAGERHTRTGAGTARRLWKCGACRRQFSVLAGTVLAGTRLPLSVVVAVLTEWEGTGRPAAAAVARRHGITPEAARHLLRRVDAAVAARGGSAFDAVLGGPVDEAAAIRWRTPARPRPRPQVGPSADYG